MDATSFEICLIITTHINLDYYPFKTSLKKPFLYCSAKSNSKSGKVVVNVNDD